jgi:hypothetical protein
MSKNPRERTHIFRKALFRGKISNYLEIMSIIYIKLDRTQEKKSIV